MDWTCEESAPPSPGRPRPAERGPNASSAAAGEGEVPATGSCGTSRSGGAARIPAPRTSGAARPYLPGAMDAPPARAFPRPSAGFLRLGAAASALYVGAQLFQAWAFRWGLPEGPGIAAEVATRLLPLDRARQLAVFASLAAIPLAYAALALATARRRPGAALVGLLCGTVFATLETAYRSIDLFAGGAWAREFAATSDPAPIHAALAGRFALFDEAVAALYLPLLLAHAAASFAFAVAVWSREGWDRALARGLGGQRRARFPANPPDARRRRRPRDRQRGALPAGLARHLRVARALAHSRSAAVARRLNRARGQPSRRPRVSPRLGRAEQVPATCSGPFVLLLADKPWSRARTVGERGHVGKAPVKGLRAERPWRERGALGRAGEQRVSRSGRDRPDPPLQPPAGGCQPPATRPTRVAADTGRAWTRQRPALNPLTGAFRSSPERPRPPNRPESADPASA